MAMMKTKDLRERKEARPGHGLSEAQLQKLGVHIWTTPFVTVVCVACGHAWTRDVSLVSGPRRNWWRCPKGCNKTARA